MEWRASERYLNIECNRDGKIRFIDSKKELTIKYASRGYYYTNYKDSNNKHTTLLPNILVATCFLKNTNNYKIVKFKNGVKNDFRVSNLFWCKNSKVEYEESDEDEEEKEDEEDDEEDDEDEEDEEEDEGIKIVIYKRTPFHNELEINRDGDIRWVGSKKPYTALKIGRTGRWYVLIGNGKGAYSLHKTVAELFVPNPKNKRKIRFIDGNETNFKADNLEWI